MPEKEIAVAKVRMIAPESRMVPWIGDRVVEPDEVIEVPDNTFESYACQSAVWEVVEEPRGSAPKKSAAKAAAPKSASGTEGGE